MKESLFEKWAKKHIDKLQNELDYMRLKKMIRRIKVSGLSEYIFGGVVITLGAFLWFAASLPPSSLPPISAPAGWEKQLWKLTLCGILAVIAGTVLLFMGRFERLYADELEIQADYWYKQYQKSQEK